MEIIGPDCEKIIMNYKKSIDFVFFQENNIIEFFKFNNYFNKSNYSLLKLDLFYNEFKELFENYYKDVHKIINFTINCYGRDHQNNHKIHQLDLQKDDDSMLYEYKIKTVHKDQNNEILIQLYNKKYDYDILDIIETVTKMDIDHSDSDSDLDGLI